MPVAGVVVFVKVTTSGAHPDVGVALKPADNWAKQLCVKHSISRVNAVRVFRFIRMLLSADD